VTKEQFGDGTHLQGVDSSHAHEMPDNEANESSEEVGQEM
jgi:hypothetical protein